MLSKLVRQLREMAPEDTGIIAYVVIFRRCRKHGIEVLITKRKSAPFKGEWALPGGHVEEYEPVLDGARREAHEETGLTLNNLQMLPPWNPGQPRYGHGNNYGVVFWTIVKESAKAKAGSDATDITWCSINKLPKLAFHNNIVIHHALSHAFNVKEATETILGSLESCLTESSDEQLKEILKDKPKVDDGILIVFEGVDGVGKSTQIDKLYQWLKDGEYPVEETKWNSSKLLKKTIKKAKDKRLLTPIMYALLHAADMVTRYEQDIVPELKENNIVLSDRYIYTSYARDKVRGVDTKLLDYIYKDFRKPDIIFHCVAPIRLAFERLMKEKGTPSWYAAGMDIGYSASKEESTIKYESECDKAYRDIFKNVDNVHELNMEQSIDKIFEDVKKVIAQKIGIGKYQK